MAENKLEGFEDLDNVLGQAEGEGGAAAEFAGELDDLLGADTAAGGAAAEPAQADSELDSFFEDLSTIDDLEVLQEEEAPAPAAAAAPEPEGEEAPAPAPAARAAPEPARPRPARPPREKKEPGFVRRWFVRLIVLGILVGGGYYAYDFFFPDAQPPWQVVQQQKTRLMGVFEKPAPKPQPPPRVEEPPPPPPPVMQPKPKPVVRAPAPPREQGPWSIQIATCFFPSCLDSYKAYLAGAKRSVVVRERMSSSESLEIYSISTWREREPAQELADRINGAHPLEGHAFLLQESGGLRISMGAFADLARANVVKDALNQQYQGQVAFATRVRAFPYKLQSVMTGRFPTREAAEQALAALKNAEPRLKDAFVARNQ